MPVSHLVRFLLNTSPSWLGIVLGVFSAASLTDLRAVGGLATENPPPVPSSSSPGSSTGGGRGRGGDRRSGAHIINRLVCELTEGRQKRCAGEASLALFPVHRLGNPWEGHRYRRIQWAQDLPASFKPTHTFSEQACCS